MIRVSLFDVDEKRPLATRWRCFPQHYVAIESFERVWRDSLPSDVRKKSRTGLTRKVDRSDSNAILDLPVFVQMLAGCLASLVGLRGDIG